MLAGRTVLGDRVIPHVFQQTVVNLLVPYQGWNKPGQTVYYATRSSASHFHMGVANSTRFTNHSCGIPVACMTETLWSANSEKCLCKQDFTNLTVVRFEGFSGVSMQNGAYGKECAPTLMI